MNSFSELIGKRYRTGGRGPDTFDCYGICIEVCKRVGIDLPELESLVGEARLFKKVDEYQPGDLVLMNANEHHVGVMIDSQNLIHTSSQIGSVARIKKVHPWVQERVTGVYRYAG